MSQSNSSPLSSPPSSLLEANSLGSTPPAQASRPNSHRDHSTQPEANPSTTATSESTIPPQPLPALELDVSPNMGAKRASKQSPKRARPEDDDGEDTPPAKKPATKSRARPKATGKKAGTKKAASEKPTPAPKKPAPKKATPAPKPSNRPTRNRKAPERFEDLEEKPTPKALPTTKGPSKVFDPVFVTTNSTSRLGKADVYVSHFPQIFPTHPRSSVNVLQHMLLEGPAWSGLSVEQQTTLVSMLPQDPINQAILERIKAGDAEDTRPQAFSMSNNCFRTDVAKFKEDLKNGHLAKTWQAAAEQAVIERAAGDYDEWKAEEAELWWGQKGK